MTLDIVSKLSTVPEEELQPLPVPAGLADRGAGLWTSVTREFEFNDAELELLFEACQTLDSLEELKQFQAGQSPVTKGSRNQDVLAPVLAHIDTLRKTYATQLKALGLSGTEIVQIEDKRTLSEKRRDAGRKGLESRWGTNG